MSEGWPEEEFANVEVVELLRRWAHFARATRLPPDIGFDAWPFPPEPGKSGKPKGWIFPLYEEAEGDGYVYAYVSMDGYVARSMQARCFSASNSGFGSGLATLQTLARTT